MTRTKTTLLLAACCAGVVLLLAPGVERVFGAEAAQQPASAERSSVLSHSRVDVLGDGRVVASFVASGDLTGQLTLTLTPAGGRYVGEWAIMVSQVDRTDPETGVEPEVHEHAEGEPDDPGHDFVQIVQRGALWGVVDDAQVVLNADGSLAEVLATLSVDQGSMEFDGATGSGQATLDALSLTF